MVDQGFLGGFFLEYLYGKINLIKQRCSFFMYKGRVFPLEAKFKWKQVLSCRTKADSIKFVLQVTDRAVTQETGRSFHSLNNFRRER